MEISEKSKLEVLITQNPSYFYEILPYAYALNVSDMWIKKFESISFAAPIWYPHDNYSTFDSSSFGNFIQHTMNSVSSSSSSSSGGGSSGGGSGGGGGSSW